MTSESNPATWPAWADNFFYTLNDDAEMAELERDYAAAHDDVVSSPAERAADLIDEWIERDAAELAAAK